MTKQLLAGYLPRRILTWVLSIWTLVTVAFLLIAMTPGDPVRAALGDMASPEAIEAARKEMGLDKPIYVQYARYLLGVLTFDLGRSTTLRVPVRDIIAERLPVTLILAGSAVLIVLIASIAIGIIVGVRTRDSKSPALEVGFTGITGFLYAIPEFVLAVLLVFVFALTLGWFPVAGVTQPTWFVLPIVALSVGSIAGLSRIVRVETLRVLQKEYMVTASAKRLSSGYKYFWHVVPNVLTATLTVAGLIFTSLVSGTVIVENIFALPGLGTTIVQAIQMKDFQLVQGLVLVLGGGVLLVNLIIDIVIAKINPRSQMMEA